MLNTTTTARRLRTPCESGAATEQLRAHDVPFEECGSWCSPKEASAHCSWCKCRACSFCRPTDELTHVYASAGIGMAACTEGSPVEWPATVPGTPTAATLVNPAASCVLQVEDALELMGPNYAVGAIRALALRSLNEVGQRAVGLRRTGWRVHEPPTGVTGFARVELKSDGCHA